MAAARRAWPAAMHRSASTPMDVRMRLEPRVAVAVGSSRPRTSLDLQARRGVTALLARWHTAAFAIIAAGVVSATALGASFFDDAPLLLLLAVVVLGVPHGALDPLLARRLGVWTGGPGLARYLAAYIGLVLAVLLAWSAAPGPSLAVFLVVSAWHFGGDWADRLGPWSRLACGAGIVALPCLTHADEVARLFALLVPNTDALLITGWLGIIAPLSLTALFLIAVATRSLSVSAELLAITALAVTLAPLAYFAIYFCALHSPRHLLRAAPRLSGVAPATTIFTTTAITTLTLGTGAAVLFAVDPDQLDAAMMRVVFIGLFALTVPHMLLGRPHATEKHRHKKEESGPALP